MNFPEEQPPAVQLQKILTDREMDDDRLTAASGAIEAKRIGQIFDTRDPEEKEKQKHRSNRTKRDLGQGSSSFHE